MIQDDHYNFNMIEIEGDGKNVTVIPFWKLFGASNVPPELIDEEEFSVMTYDMYRFLAWLFPRQYGVKQLE